jgi:hypothetical protein
VSDFFQRDKHPDMRHFYRIAFIVIIIFVFSSFSIKRMDYRQAKNKNVCKELSGEVLVYFIFVDSKETSPWTEFDIQSTIDSLETAVQWIKRKATENHIPLRIVSDYHIGNEYTTVRKNLPNGTVQKSITEPNLKTGLYEMNRWADNIARTVGSTFSVNEKDGLPEIKNPRDKERLIAYLRDENQVESVALLYLVNNYFRSDISIPVNTMDTDDVEFAVLSYKYPSVIAHNILHLFGAADLFETPYRRNQKKIEELQQVYPDDIMTNVYGRYLHKLDIGDYTQYLIGWKDEISPKHKPLLIDKFYNF